MYKALMRFADLEDAGRIYEAGDTFPRLGLHVTEKRLAELAGSDNRAGKPLIQAVEAPVKAATEKAVEIPAEPEKSARKPRRSRKKEE